MTTDYSSPLHETLLEFLPQFYRFINPIIHVAEYKGHRMTEYQIKVIMFLSMQGASTPGEISRTLDIQKGSLTGVLKSLLALGLVNRNRHDHDERSYHVFLTASGRDFVRFHLDTCNSRLSELFEDIGENDRGVVENGLRTLTIYLKAKGNDPKRS